MAPPIPSCPRCGSAADVELLEVPPPTRGGVEFKYTCWNPFHGQGFAFSGNAQEWERYYSERHHPGEIDETLPRPEPPEFFQRNSTEGPT
jgi:hypothetical protein